MSFKIILMCGCKKKAGSNFILVNAKHGFYPLAYEFYFQKYRISDVKKLIVLVHVAIKLCQQRVIRSDVFKTTLRMSSKKLEKQAVILVSVSMEFQWSLAIHSKDNITKKYRFIRIDDSLYKGYL